MMLGLGFPFDVWTSNKGADDWFVTSERIPMLLVGKDVARASGDAQVALGLVADYLLSLGPSITEAYLKGRGVDHTLTVVDAGRPVSDHRPLLGIMSLNRRMGGSHTPFRLGGGVLVHGRG